MMRGTQAEDRVTTLDDLKRSEGQAELIGGRIVRYPPMGCKPSSIVGNIFACLDDHANALASGHAYTSTLVYAIPRLASGRESLSPDVSYYDGPLPQNVMSFVEGPPIFAVEIRSENDFGDAAEAEMAAKRADYFAAGTQVVWDVDPIADTIACYRASDPTSPSHFCRGQTADAEPAVPGWRISVDDVYA